MRGTPFKERHGEGLIHIASVIPAQELTKIDDLCLEMRITRSRLFVMAVRELAERRQRELAQSAAKRAPRQRARNTKNDARNVGAS